MAGLEVFRTLAWLWLLLFLPAMWLAYSASALSGVVFALGKRGIMRTSAILVCLGVGAGVAFLLDDYSVGIATVINVSLWLLARYRGIGLMRARHDVATILTPATGFGKWQFSIGYLLWLEVAIAYVFATAHLCKSSDSADTSICDMFVEAAIAVSIFVAIISLCVRAKPPSIYVVLLLVVVWPVCASVVGISIPLSDWTPSLERNVRALLWGVPVSTLMCLVFRRHRVLSLPAGERESFHSERLS